MKFQNTSGRSSPAVSIREICSVAAEASELSTVHSNCTPVSLYQRCTMAISLMSTVREASPTMAAVSLPPLASSKAASSVMMGSSPFSLRNAGVSLVSPLVSPVEASPEVSPLVEASLVEDSPPPLQPANAMVSSRSVARSSARVLFFMIVPPKNVVRFVFMPFLHHRSTLVAGRHLPSFGWARKARITFYSKGLSP